MAGRSKAQNNVHTKRGCAPTMWRPVTAHHSASVLEESHARSPSRASKTAATRLAEQSPHAKKRMH